MFDNLTRALSEVLHLASAPTLVRKADVTFDRPAETYQPGNTCINLFLFDVRERSELRSSEPVIQRDAGGKTVSIMQAPMRIACSYLVTAWIESGQTGQSAILNQHDLLAQALLAFSAMPTLSGTKLSTATRAWLNEQPYAVELAVLQSDLTKNMSEFWTAVGGKLRPSFTLTATVAMVSKAESMSAPLVSSKEIVINKSMTDAPVIQPKPPTRKNNRR
ncbi:DUF4255 domain-containing protein [Herbaspirillum rhizosphaerae]|uniref:DUF4255 domain-containing protein n=1 Tax=Herbaspirillum rhizosphaerae TaxID=346179 RepID=UPI00067D754D|nr:DUF4255 domain-containing protein [Herbaspirillum rhizosphaerae]